MGRCDRVHEKENGVELGVPLPGCQSWGAGLSEKLDQ